MDKGSQIIYQSRKNHIQQRNIYCDTGLPFYAGNKLSCAGQKFQY